MIGALRSRRPRRLAAGDVVEVRPALEDLAGLERDGTVDRLPVIRGDCIVLEGAECSGLYHGSCTRRTDTYWRAAWPTRDEGDGQVATGG